MARAYYGDSNGEYYLWTPQMIGSEDSNGLVQAASYVLDDGCSISDFATKHQSFAGSVCMYHSDSWFNLLSIRHRNNTSDGTDYGMMLYAPLNTFGNLAWRQQAGALAGWGNERIIADSLNSEIVVSSSQPTNPNAKIWVQI